MAVEVGQGDNRAPTQRSFCSQNLSEHLFVRRFGLDEVETQLCKKRSKVADTFFATTER